MELLYRYEQEKKEKQKNLSATCVLTVSSDSDFLIYTGDFFSEFMRIGNKNAITFTHEFVLNKKNGDFTVTYRIDAMKQRSYRLYKPGNWVKKNNFQFLNDLIDRGFYNGEKRINYWGVKYKKAISEVFNIFLNELSEPMAGSYLEDKNYLDKPYISPLYDLLVDYHLLIKKIKPHDDIYNDILYDYPKPIWLKKNDNKFIPALLDSYGIKGGYLIKELSHRTTKNPIMIKSLNFLCKLFGENYIDYLKKINWKEICTEKVTPKVFYTCKNTSEKDFIVKTLNNWDNLNLLFDGQLKSIYEAFSTKAFIEDRGIELKFKSKNTYEFHNLLEKWKLIKKHIKIGFKLRYQLPKEIIEELEQPIVHEEKVYTPILVLSEDQFRIEGMLMKNCMGGQFNLGAYYLYVAISCGSKRVNIQYRKGNLAQARGKTNIDLPQQFQEPVNVFTKRMEKYGNLTWKKEKYDYITN